MFNRIYADALKYETLLKKIVFRSIGALIVTLMVLIIFSYGRNARYIAGVTLGLPSFILLIISRRQLGKSFSYTPEAKTLIVKDLYSKIQHPMYVFLDLFLSALMIIIGYSILLVPWGILVSVQIMQAHREEQLLATTFGKEYLAYLTHTWF
jgi:protein-S-isoprenylcysteine O-methyltransferase Ste14